MNIPIDTNYLNEATHIQIDVSLEPAWIRATEKAARLLRSGATVTWLVNEYKITTPESWTFYSNGLTYCTCTAHDFRIACWHAAAARLVGRMRDLRIRDSRRRTKQLKQLTLKGDLTNNVEHKYQNYA